MIARSLDELRVMRRAIRAEHNAHKRDREESMRWLNMWNAITGVMGCAIRDQPEMNTEPWPELHKWLRGEESELDGLDLAPHKT